MSKPLYVIDSCALIALLHNEKGWKVVAEILLDVRNGDAQAYIHKINLTEVYYDLLRNAGEKASDKIFDDVKTALIQVDEQLTDEFIKSVGWFKVNHKVSLGDCFALALTKKLDASLLTSDHHEFDAIEKTGIVKFKWIR